MFDLHTQELWNDGGQQIEMTTLKAVLGHPLLAAPCRGVRLLDLDLDTNSSVLALKLLECQAHDRTHLFKVQQIWPIPHRNGRVHLGLRSIWRMAFRCWTFQMHAASRSDLLGENRPAPSAARPFQNAWVLRIAKKLTAMAGPDCSFRREGRGGRRSRSRRSRRSRRRRSRSRSRNNSSSSSSRCRQQQVPVD